MRELQEETGLVASAIGELGVFSDPKRDPRERVITIAFYALVKPSEVEGGDDADEAAWYSIDALPALAFDHADIINAALERLRRDIHFEPIGFDLLDDEFTIPDLQRLYEIILGVKFDRRNFQRKIMASGILEEADAEEELREPEAHMMKKCSAEPLPVMADMDMEFCGMPEPMAEASAKPKRRPGRIASLFRLNKVKYMELKDEGNKMEF